ncbi:DUF4082 domain-containing protein [Spirosoma endbachense]|uniref:DUF4082 domain-containing protein n=1 Tax=Spirosoma endbachense TaxID=2666025 RepID=A0A6P1W515_9BACT|nr:DUF4082 domain-containing protein [Spirosoma endbachense]QHV99432.1 DUF4082 domain-containing protein [Spirosoma endbachense]
MRSSLLFVAPFFALLLGLGACGSKDSPPPVENPITQYLDADTTLKRAAYGPNAIEFGLVFSATVDGKLTEVGCEMPDPGSYRVSVWDNQTKALLRQKTIEQSSPGKLTMSSIDALALTANKKYIISINSQSGGVNRKYHSVIKKAGGEFIPFTKGSILVYNTSYRTTAMAVFPDEINNLKQVVYGYPEFTFVKD